MSAQQPNPQPGANNESPDDEAQLADWLQHWIAYHEEVSPQEVGRDTSFVDLGIDSKALVGLSGALSERLGQTVAPTLLYSMPDIRRLSKHLAARADAEEGSPGRPDAGVTQEGEPIAIVGMACRFPGAPSVDAFWSLLTHGVDAVTEVPSTRWDAHAEPGASRWGGFIDGVEHFDAAFFGISPREAQNMDPQQRLLLQTAWHALEHAGIPPDTLAGSRTGVFVGISTNDYRELQFAHAAGTEAHAGTGNALSIAANRISYFLDLRGPSLAIDTACSSSLVAVHQARVNLLAGECDLAIVGGVNLMLAPSNTLIFSNAQMMASDGRCKTFDERADGYVRGEGCGVVVLRRQSDAVKGNNRILAVIPGSAVNQDGKSNGLTAPNGVAQRAMVSDALAAAGLSPQQIGYVEAHGTGTSLGDPIEVNALKEAYGAPVEGAPRLWIGSVKTQIGHLEAAAGIAGLIKTVLVLRHGRIPQQLHLQKINPLISLAGSRVAIPTTPQVWETDGQTLRRAGVSSFGFGGTNSHVIVQEALSDQQAQVEDEPGWQLLGLSARSEAALNELASRHADLLQHVAGTVPFHAICHAANSGRSHHPIRMAWLARSTAEMQSLLAGGAAGDMAGDVFTAPLAAAADGKLAFLFTGQGSQYVGMGHGLYLAHAGFRQAIDECDEILQRLQGWSLRSLLGGDEEAGLDLDQTQYAQPALFALEYALARWWQSNGVQPDCLMGHSLGEYVAACIAGVFSLEDGLKLVSHRGRLMQEKTLPGAMYAVFGSPELIAQVIDETRGQEHQQWSIAAHNSPEELVLSGSTQAVEAMASQLAERGAMITALQVTRAFHSPLMQRMVDEFEEWARTVAYHPPSIPLVSNLTGGLAGTSMSCAAYWVDHVLAPVEFAAGLRALAEQGCRRFIEIGPKPILTGFGQKMIPDALWLHSLRRNRDDERVMLGQLATWYVHGGEVDWKQSNEARRGSPVASPVPVALPLYPFQEDRHWFESCRLPSRGGLELSRERESWPGRRVDVAVGDITCFEATLPGAADFLRDHRVRGRTIVPAAAYVSLMLSAIAQSHATPAGSAPRLLDLQFIRPLDLTDGEVRVQTVLKRESLGWSAQVCAWDSATLGWQVHATAVLDGSSAAGAAASESPVQDVGPVDDVAGLYGQWVDRGLHYGERFQCIRTLARRESTAAGRLALAVEALQVGPAVLHPALLDAAFQTVIALLPHTGDTSPCTPIPARMERFVLHAAPATEMSVQTHVRHLDDSEVVADIMLRAVDGAVIAEVSGIALRLIPSEVAFVQQAQGDAAAKFFLPAWSDVGHLAALAKDAVAAEAVLYVYPPCAEPLVQALSTCHGGARRFDVVLSDATRQRALNEWDIDVADSAAFSTVLPQLPSFDTVYFLGGIQPAAVALDDVSVAALEEQGVISLFRQFKALAQLGYGERRLVFKAITNGTQAVLPGETMLPISAGIGGFLKTAAQEYPDWTICHADIGAEEVVGSTRELQQVARLVAAETQPEIALRVGCRFERVLQPVALEAAATWTFRERGTYLIIGGASGIGFEVARHLSQTVKARLVLVGRSPLDTALEQRIAEVEALGGEALYLQADVTHGGDMQEVVRQAKARFGLLNGVIHSALVLRDKSLENLDEATLQAVLDPKVQGSVALYRAVAHEPLDFLLFFSSVLSVLGSAGQANYVAASACQDALAHALALEAGFPVKLINWGYWGEVGAVTSADYRARLAQRGITPISTREGLAALECALAAPASQLIYVHAEPRVLDALRVDGTACRQVCAAHAAPATSSVKASLKALSFESDATGADRFSQAMRAEAAFSVKVLLKSLQDNGCFLRADESHEVDRLRLSLKILPRYFPWFDAVIAHLVEAGQIERQGARIQTTAAIEVQEPSQLQQARSELLSAFPELEARIALLEACSERLWHMVRGTVPPTQVLFPDGSMTLVEGVYRGNSTADRFTHLAAASVAALVEYKLSMAGGAEPIRILEIGAGTGGTTTPVVAALEAAGLQFTYVYTDISPAFLRHGEQRFGSRPQMVFRTLDIEKDPVLQGFEPGHFDIVLAADVLHATRDVACTLERVKWLLKRHGTLVLNESTQPTPLCFTLTFGMLEGWWSFEDAWRRSGHSPLLDADQWARQLALRGFGDFTAVGAERRILIAHSDGIVSDARHVAKATQHRAPLAVPVKAPVSALTPLADLVALPIEQASCAILQSLGKLVGEILRIDMERACADERALLATRLSDLGIDSLMAMELRKRIRDWVSVDVSANTLIGNGRLADVVQLIQQKLMARQMVGAKQSSGDQAMEVLVL